MRKGRNVGGKGDSLIGMSRERSTRCLKKKKQDEHIKRKITVRFRDNKEKKARRKDVNSSVHRNY